MSLLMVLTYTMLELLDAICSVVRSVPWLV